MMVALYGSRRDRTGIIHSILKPGGEMFCWQPMAKAAGRRYMLYTGGYADSQDQVQMAMGLASTFSGFCTPSVCIKNSQQEVAIRDN